MIFRILTFILIFGSLTAVAQKDLIVTQAGQEIRCKILEESSMRFTYAYINDKGKVLKTEIFKTLISSYKYGYYPEDVLPNEKLFKGEMVVKGNPVVKKAEPKPSKKKEEPDNREQERVDKKEAAKDKQDSRKKKESSKKEPEKQVVESKKIEEEPVKVIDKNEKLKSSPKDKLEPIVTKTADEEVKPLVEEKPVVDEKESKEKLSPEERNKTEFTNYLKYRFGFKGGLGNIMTENTDKSPFGLYKEKLNRGWVYGVDAAMFLNDNIGVGATFHSFNSRNRNERLDYIRTGSDEFRTGSLENKVSHKFVGASLLYRMSLDYKTFIVATASPGYFFYSDKRLEDQMNVNLKGGTFGAAGTLGIDFLIGDDKFGRDVILSFECGYNYGELKKLNYGGVEGVKTLDTPKNLRRLDFAIALRFNRFPRYLK